MRVRFAHLLLPACLIEAACAGAESYTTSRYEGYSVVQKAAGNPFVDAKRIVVEPLLFSDHGLSPEERRVIADSYGYGLRSHRNKPLVLLLPEDAKPTDLRLRTEVTEARLWWKDDEDDDGDDGEGRATVSLRIQLVRGEQVLEEVTVRREEAFDVELEEFKGGLDPMGAAVWWNICTELTGTDVATYLGDRAR